MIFDEPTRGIDVDAKQEIYKLMSSLAENGMSLVIISLKMLELLGISDKLFVMHESIITGELYRLKATQDKILQIVSHIKTQEVQ